MTLKRFSRLCSILMAILIVSCSGPEEKRMKFFNKGKALYEKGEYVQAKLEFKNSLQIDPNFAEGYYMLGMVELYEKNWRNAYGLFSKAVELDADLLGAQVALGKILIMARQKNKAREKADLVLAKDPNHEDALLLRATCLKADQNDVEAERILKSVIEKNPNRPDPYLMLANMKLKGGDAAGARNILQGLLSRDETNQVARLMLIQILEKNQDLTGAEAEFKALISQDPENDTPKLLLASFYNRTNRSKEAENILKDLTEAHPDKVESHLYLARFYKEKEQNDAMVAVLHKTIEDMPDKYAAYDMLAKHYLQTKAKNEAIELLEQFMTKVGTGPDFLRAKLLMAGIHYQEEEFDDALKLADEVLKENAKDVGAHLLKGNVLAVRRDLAGAIGEYRAVLREEPQNISASLKLAKVHLFNDEASLAEDTYKKILEINPKESQARFGLADVYRRKGQLEPATEQLQEVLTINPDDTHALMALGDVSLARKDLEGAGRYFTRLSALEPHSAPVHYKNGVIKLMGKKPKEAASLFEKALNADPDFVPALSQLMNMLVKEKKLDKAFERCRQQIAKSPNNPRYHVLLGGLHAFGKDFDAARNSFEKALDIDPDSSDALFSLARLEQSLGSIDEALAKYQKLRERNPNNLRIAMLVAILLEQKGEYEQAIGIYAQVLKKNPNSSTAANNLAFYYAEHDPTTENLGKAEKLISPLLEKFKDNPYVVDTAAWIYYRKGDFEMAKGMLLGVEEKAQNGAIFNYHLGMICLRLGEKDKAKQYLNLAINSDQPFPGRTEAETLYSSLSEPSDTI